MSDSKPSDAPRRPPEELAPELRRGMSRRGFLTDELGRATMRAAQQLPALGRVLGLALRETARAREERIVHQLWQLLTDRAPKPHEASASLEVVRKATTAEEKADALVDVAWALCQTREFVELNRPNEALVRGLYRIALDRAPTEEELAAALAILEEAPEAAARGAAVEGLLAGLLRSSESVLRKPAR